MTLFLRPVFTALTLGFVVRSTGSCPPIQPDFAVSFLSRAFFPAAGINEDPVTGSAHCALAPYWAKKVRRTPPHAIGQQYAIYKIITCVSFIMHSAVHY
jgi:predicted PhzF superfamily epimerase YddE/YHI9